MKTLTEQIRYIREHKKIGLMTHVVAGYPTLAETEKIITTMEVCGVDFIEIQIPFSDPIADGATIMKANDIALSNDTKVADVFALLKKLKKKIEIPLLCMCYYNTIHHYGVQKFCTAVASIGVQGLIVPDMPIDEEPYEGFYKNCVKNDLVPIRVLSPTSTIERIDFNIQEAQGFIYCTTVSGTTGIRSNLSSTTKNFLKKMKKLTAIPIATGFGISRPEHIAELVGIADIAVVGSAVIQEIEKNGSDKIQHYLATLVTETLKRES